MKTGENKNKLCDVCNSLIATEFGVLSAHWGQGSRHCGEEYKVHLCEGCFFRALAGLRKDHFVNHMFDKADDTQKAETFGLIADNASAKG